MDHTEDKFKDELNKILAAAGRTGGCSIEIRADYLYSRVAGYCCESNKMLICSRVMRDCMELGDEILEDPPDSDGRFLKVKYQLPRRARGVNRTEGITEA